MKERTRTINKQSSINTIIILLAANALLALVWYSELYIPQTYTQQFNQQLIANNINQINENNAKVCLDTTTMRD